MNPAVDLTGHTFGRWTVLARGGTNKKGGALWLCRCACGTEREIPGYNLRAGDSSSCGCTIRAARIEMVGGTFGSWTVIEPRPSGRQGARYLCRCACGTERVVSGRGLRRGRSKSCGGCSGGVPRVRVERPKRIRAERAPAPEHPTQVARMSPRLAALETAKRCPRCSLLIDTDEHICLENHGSLGLGGISALVAA